MKRRRRHLKLKITITVIVALLVLIVVLFLRNVTDVIISVSEATIRSVTTVAVNDAIYYTLNDNVRYEDLITIKYDEEGNVSTITTDSLKINRIARDTAYLSQENLTAMSAEGIEVPLGAFTGIEAVAGFGPTVHIEIIPIPNVECRFVSKFEEAGINQTKHSLYLEIVSDISIIMPQRTSNLASTIEVLVCESIINGKIPDVYLQTGLTGGALVPAR